MGYVWCDGYVWDMSGFRYANNLLKNPATKRLSGKNKIADPNSPACTYMGLAILALFAFLHDVRPCARW